MDRNEQLYENYEDALFKVLMNKVSEAEGERLIEENERLKGDPAAAVPEHIDKACMETIRRHTAKKQRKTGHVSVWTVMQRVAVVLVLLFALFLVAYAAVPEFRADTLNVLIKTSRVRSQLDLSGDEESGYSGETDAPMVAGYSLPVLSEGFSETGRGADRLREWVKFSKDDGTMIYVLITKLQEDGQVGYIDNENTEMSKPVTINGFEGLVVEKNNTIRVNWYDTGNNRNIELTFQNLDEPFALYFAENMEYIGS